MAGNEQPPHSPPEQWAARTDAGARKVVGRLDELADELDELRTEVRAYREHTVTHTGMIGWVGAAAITIVTAAWVVTTRSVDQVEKVGTKAEAAVSTLRVEVVDNKRAASAEVIEVRKDIRALSEAIFTRRRQPRLETALDEP